MQTLPSRIDHVAVAVADLDAAERRWRDQLGGRVVGWNAAAEVYRNRQYRYRGGGKLELIGPVAAGDGSFVDRFLERFGSRIHHVTLMVDDVPAAVDVVGAHGLDVVDVDVSDPEWHEGFLRPSQVGGLVVQLARRSHTDEEWAQSLGHEVEPVPDDAAVLHGPLLGHPDLGTARSVWTVLGADVERDGDRIVCRWDDAPLDVVVVEAAAPGPIGLRFSDAAGYPAATRHVREP